MMEPVIVPIRHKKALVVGLLTLPLAALACVSTIPAILYVGLFQFATFISLFLTASLTFAAFSSIAIGWRRPIALRMDDKGISGYYCDPASWDEIKEVTASSDLNGKRYLGFKLHDPIAFRDRQTAWGRLKSWSSERGSGHHLIVPASVIDGHDIEELATHAQRFHAAAVSDSHAQHTSVT